MTLQAGRVYGSMGRLGVGKQTSAAAWWLSGGISAANCIAAYQPKGAADLAASYVNLANPGTYNAAPGVAPTWAAADGWTFGGTNYLLCGSATLNHNDITVIVRADPADNIRRTLFTCTTTNAPLYPSFELNADGGGKGMAILQPGSWRLRNDNCHDNGEHVFAFTVSLYPTADIMYGGYYVSGRDRYRWRNVVGDSTYATDRCEQYGDWRAHTAEYTIIQWRNLCAGAVLTEIISRTGCGTNSGDGRTIDNKENNKCQLIFTQLHRPASPGN